MLLLPTLLATVFSVLLKTALHSPSNPSRYYSIQGFYNNPFVLKLDFAHDRNDPGTKPMRGEEAHAKVFLETVEAQERNGALPLDVREEYV